MGAFDSASCRCVAPALRPRAAPPARPGAIVSTRTLEILQHSLGLDEFGRGPAYRNRFVTGGSGPDHEDCARLEGEGLMVRVSVAAELIGGGTLFCVTDAGRRYVRERGPAPPKLTRSQQRYERYLDADSDLSFGEWICAYG
jgi:hypothetical protein